MSDHPPLSFVDTHAHLDDKRFRGDIKGTVSRARKAGVTTIVTVGTDIPTSETAIRIAAEYDRVYAAAGVHPHDASHFDDTVLQQIRELCAGPKVIAVGEIGLDYFKNYSPHETQKETYRRQVELAAEIDLPVIVHSRDAADDCLEVLETFRGTVRGVAHCFSGDVETARAFLDLGFYISFSGTITYPNARTLAEVAKMVPDNRILVETDCPYLPPQSFRGKRNEPAYVCLAAERLAELRETDIETISRLTTNNACALFLFPAF